MRHGLESGRGEEALVQKNRGSGDQGARGDLVVLLHCFGHGHEVEEPESTEFQNFHEGRGGLVTVTVPGSRLQRCLELLELLDEECRAPRRLLPERGVERRGSATGPRNPLENTLEPLVAHVKGPPLLAELTVELLAKLHRASTSTKTPVGRRIRAGALDRRVPPFRREMRAHRRGSLRLPGPGPGPGRFSWVRSSSPIAEVVILSAPHRLHI